jgi:hypothetical protein
MHFIKDDFKKDPAYKTRNLKQDCVVNFRELVKTLDIVNWQPN